jgi:hypothetical protein
MQEATTPVPLSTKEINLSEKDAVRFWQKADKSAGPDACWPWTAYKKPPEGYGVFNVFRKMFRAHRVAWTLANGPIPRGLQVCHHCDNPPCCNPAHLFLGTHLDNARDKASKGRCNSPKGEKNGMRLHPERRPRGETHGSAKLTAAQVLEIRALYAAGGTSLSKLARQFGLGISPIFDIIKLKNWAHV